ncbi:MAG: ATP-binding cassette domain-containing protein [Candidatus Jordarchaeales archaeon]|nr:ATP-binding cassette domain-containing protein [Candidatus Jordarchaeia archaeon]
MKIESITIIGGYGKSGLPEPVREVELRRGEIVSIVGPTGSGKTTLINDIEMFASGDTPTKRKILVNGGGVPEEIRSSPHINPIARITQHTTFLSDLPVYDFLSIHAMIRQDGDERLVKRTLDLANQLSGENIVPNIRMTELSGGQTRALLIADAVVIGNTPVVLIDEVENTGIYKDRALKILRECQKMLIFVTHDPLIALSSDLRIVMRNGAMVKVVRTTEDEKAVLQEVKRLDDILSELRENIRLGNPIGLKKVVT